MQGKVEGILICLLHIPMGKKKIQNRKKESNIIIQIKKVYCLFIIYRILVASTDRKQTVFISQDFFDLFCICLGKLGAEFFN